MIYHKRMDEIGGMESGDGEPLIGASVSYATDEDFQAQSHRTSSMEGINSAGHSNSYAHSGTDLHGGDSAAMSHDNHFARNSVPVEYPL